MSDTQQPSNPYAPAPTSDPKQKNTLGLIALIIAIVGTVVAWIPLVGFVGWLFLTVALVLSIIALVQKNKKKGLAIGALITSIVGSIIAAIVFVAVTIAAFSPNLPEVTSGSETSEEAQEEAPAEEATPADEAGTRENPVAIGDTITGGDFEVRINSVQLDAAEAVANANMFNEPAAEGFAYAIINATVKYLGDESSFSSFVSIDYVNPSGEVLDEFDNMAVAPEPMLGLAELYNGGEDTGNIVIAIPTAADGVLRVTPDMFGDPIFVSLR
jgi:hypothetical protein